MTLELSYKGRTSKNDISSENLGVVIAHPIMNTIILFHIKIQGGGSLQIQTENLHVILLL